MSVAWSPEQSDLDWTLKQLNALGVDEVWSTGEMQYKRTGVKELSLLTRTERAGEAHARLLTVLSELGWSCDDSGAAITPDDPMEQMLHAQREAQDWACPSEDCDTRLVDCGLEKARWVSHGLQLAVNPNTGDETEAERWLVHLRCVDCAEDIRMNPLDYALIAGDDLFHTYTTATHVYHTLSREALIALVDAGEGDTGTALGSRDLDGDLLPPHLQGTFCLISDRLESEEE